MKARVALIQSCSSDHFSVLNKSLLTHRNDDRTTFKTKVLNHDNRSLLDSFHDLVLVLMEKFGIYFMYFLMIVDLQVVVSSPVTVNECIS